MLRGGREIEELDCDFEQVHGRLELAVRHQSGTGNALGLTAHGRQLEGDFDQLALGDGPSIIELYAMLAEFDRSRLVYAFGFIAVEDQDTVGVGPGGVIRNMIHGT